jgi:hypothetical protein
VAEQLQAQHNAVKMLANRVRLILEYIRAMERGEVPKSHEVLREAKSLTHRLPVLNSEIFQEEYYTVYLLDVNLVVFLTLVFFVFFSNTMMSCCKPIWHPLPKRVTIFTNLSQNSTYFATVKVLWVAECAVSFSKLSALYNIKCFVPYLIHGFDQTHFSS